MLAIGTAALVLFLVGEPADAAGDPQEGVTPQETLVVDTAAADTAAADTTADPDRALEEATGTLRALARDAYAYLPKLGVALLLLVVAGVLAKLVRWGLRSALKSWERAEATAALVGIGIWLIALGAALSVLAGDARALVGSVGLFGLALSWALQAPIESFTGWLLNSFRSYYRIGDRIAVGEVFGDVARIDFLTTTVFEAGGPDKRVQAAQSTGALITFPNSEVLRSNIVNFTRDFPFVWDELTVAVANESDLPVAMERIREVADRVVGLEMQDSAEEYAALLDQARLSWNAATRPEVYLSTQDSWTDITVRYVVPAREMRKWSTRLQLAVNEELGAEDISARVFPAYPRTQIQPVPRPPWARAGAGQRARRDEEG